MLNRKSLWNKTWCVYRNWSFSLLEIHLSRSLLWSRHATVILVLLSILSLLLWSKSTSPSIVLILISISLLRHKPSLLLSWCAHREVHAGHGHKHRVHIHHHWWHYHRHLLLEILEWHDEVRLRHLLHVGWNVHVHRRIHFESHESILVLILNIACMIFFVMKSRYKWFLSSFEHFV